MKRIIALAIAILVLGGCASKEATNENAGATTSVATPSSAEGCTVTETEEMYVAEMYACADRSTRVYVFSTSSARDNWRKAAEEFGSVVVGQGDTWLEVKA
jgi:uncharacterized lipoprotein YajG